ncbi:Cystathionine beta-lyase [Roseovarius sp. THAF8]|uniref:cystathionine beta-lyase n=1 Tax=Roseovarius sp. THAF8 TaxID=2587846 RepID=UPI0012690D62|nr:cystathionine beta-lyase [Roseovarius sp. THAF8]QFT96764.1 Cystathionine beta-lyase [Roseovarius sp. THAF8]
MNRETMLMHFGRTQTPGPANPPIVRASTVLHDTVESYRETKAARDTDDRVLSYGRRGTTTAHELSAALCSLEEAEACFLFPTGVAAIAGGLMPYLASGDHLLVVDTIFPATRSFCDTVLARYGVEVDYIPWSTTDLSEYVKPSTRLVLAESPASQTYEVMDLPALCKNAHDHGLIVAADNTYGSSWLYRPLALGCDVSIIAGTKYIGGHADSMMGAVAARGQAVDALRKHTATTGQTISPDDAYACIRGLRTLGLRMERHGENGLALAQWFQGRSEVSRVLHPGLPDHPGAGIWARDASGTNGLLTVDFCDWFDAERFVDRLQLFSIGSSWGGFESLAMPCTPDYGRAFGSDTGARAMIRFHAGLEHVDDLIADLDQSFCNA